MAVMELNQQAQDFARKTGKLLIDGEWVEAASGKTFEPLIERFVRDADLICESPAIGRCRSPGVAIGSDGTGRSPTRRVTSYRPVLGP
jgi:hypothetical protein